jgi:hypothetical protein
VVRSLVSPETAETADDTVDLLEVDFGEQATASEWFRLAFPWCVVRLSEQSFVDGETHYWRGRS